MLYSDPPVSGWWQNYRTGESDTWTAAGGETLSTQERESLRLRIEADKQARLAAQEQRHSEVATKAEAIFRELPSASEDKPYLKRKGVRPAGDLRLKDSSLVVPLLSLNGNLQSLQFIHEDGTKRFLTGGKTAGGFFPIKGCDGPLYIVEGIATGLSVHEATGGTVLCAFNAGNLKSVSEMARATYPERGIVIAGDNDQKTKGNPGKTKAEEAAKVINGKVVVPDFGAISELSDFNDLHVSQGLDEVKRQLRRSGVWPTPVRLDDVNLPELDLGMLPGFLATFCGAVSSSLQIPVELVLSAALAAVATAVQGKARVLVKTDYSEPLNIYQCCALPPGERKSAVVDICKAPLVHWQAEKRAEMADTIRVAKSERQTMELAIANMRSRAAREEDPDTLRELSSEIADIERDLPEVPHPPRLLADDVTPEALAAIMEPLGGCISIIEAEGDILDILGGRYSSGKANLGLVLKAYSQEPIHVDRRGRDPIVLESPTLTLAVFPQPKVIADMREQSAFRARGFVARFLFWLPKSRLGNRR